MTNRREFLKIAGLTAAWPCAGAWAQAPGVLVNDLHSQLNPTRVELVVEPETLDAARAAIAAARRENRAVCIAGGRHAMGAQAFATDGVLIDIRKLDRVLGFDMERGLIEVESGMQWPKLLAELTAAQRGREKQWGFAQKQTGADRLTMGGCLSANVHGRGLTLPPFVGDVESFKLLDAKGELFNCSRAENPELFRLAIGGYGLFGFIYSVTLRLVPRRKVERVVQVRDIAEIPAAFAGRIRDGFLYGDFQYSIDESSDGYLRRGVFSCYRPVPDSTPIPAAQKELAERDWTNLLLLAHTDKAAAFKRYAGYYLTTNRQVYWSDEHQMSIYPDYYHREIDRRLKTKATEAITEIYCERGALERFMVDVAADARRNETEIIYGTVRVIEADRESFLAWAKKPYACVIFNLHVVHTPGGMRRASNAFRRLIDLGIKYGGSYYPTYHKYATRKQVETCYPQFAEFLKLKLKHDPAEVFQSDWYRHYRKMFAS
ncbi:MAG TPA: FAD-binding oxidoreductase [Burkholderiales bacterium]|nr:FAD-binding oxidoreductase [Burkholderiales bacterium]